MTSTTASTTSRKRSITTSSYVFGGLGGTLRGYELGIVAGALLYVTPALHLTPSLRGAVVSSALFGSMIGALAVGPISDRIGRRKIIAASAVLFGIAALGAAVSPSAIVLIAARIVLGLAVGASTATIPVYISEIAPAVRRGSFSALFQVLITTGVLLASVAALLLSPYHAWRWMFGIGVVPALIMLGGAFFLPESPRWLVKQGRETEARAVLQRTRDQTSLDEEIAAIKGVRQQERQLGLGALLSTSRLRRLLLIGVGLGVFQQLQGNNTVTYYAPATLTSIGYSKTVAIGFNLGLSVIGLIMTMVMAFVIIDRVGRKKPLMFGALGMALSMVILGIAFHGGQAGGAVGYVAITGLALFKISFTLSWGGIVWVLLGEMFPLHIRGTAMGIATFATEAVSVGISYAFPILRTLGNGTVFFIFAAMGVLAFLFATFLVPETKNRSLEDIEADLALGTGRHQRAGAVIAATSPPNHAAR